jgi:hypothetical protein
MTMKTLLLILAVLLLVSSAACSDNGSGGASPGCDGGPPLTPTCAVGVKGGVCSDSQTMPRVCSGGAWVCPSGTVLTTECGCTDLPPPPGCTRSGCDIVCPDAAAQP